MNIKNIILFIFFLLNIINLSPVIANNSNTIIEEIANTVDNGPIIDNNENNNKENSSNEIISTDDSDGENKDYNLTNNQDQNDGSNITIKNNEELGIDKELIEDINTSIDNNDIIDNVDIEKNEESTNYVIDRVNNVKDRFGIDQNTQNEESLDSVKDGISKTDLELSIIQEFINKEIAKKNNNNEILKNNKDSIEQLEEEINKLLDSDIGNSNELIDKLNNEISSLKEKNLNIEKNNEELKNSIEISKIKMQGLQNEIATLNIYKKKYEDIVLLEKEQTNQKRTKHIITYIGFILVALLLQYILTYIRDKRRDNNQKSLLKNLYIYDVIIWIILVFVLIFYTLIIYPQVAILFIFLGSGLLFAVRPIISSFFATIGVISSYNEGDIVQIEDIMGKIVKFNLLSVSLKELDTYQVPTKKFKRIPNNIFIEKAVGKLNKGVLKKDMTIFLKIANNDNFEGSVLQEFTNDLQNIFNKYNDKYVKYTTNITMKSNDEVEIELTFYYENIVSIGKDIEMSIINLIETKYIISDNKD